jgi:16S rRNA pseudouridine516 synthase
MTDEVFQRLDRYLSRSGAATRAEARKAIQKGLVEVDGSVCRIPGTRISSGKTVCLGGKRIIYREHTYLMLNKPRGILSATTDKKEKTVIDLIGSEYNGKLLSSAGRLDKDAEGLMILTDDGGLIHEVISPRGHVPKKYYVRAEGSFNNDFIQLFKAGLKLDKDFVTLPAMLEVTGTAGTGEFYLTIFEGKFHQVKKMFAHIGMKVIYLKRISINGVELDAALLPGMYRELRADEVDSLRGL